MRVFLENVSDGEEFPHPVVLIRGTVKGSHTQREVVASMGETLVRVRSDDRGRFKCLLHLLVGENQVLFSSGDRVRGGRGTGVLLRFRPELAPKRHRIRLVYVVCRDSDGRFQSADGDNNSVESAQRRLSLAGALLQCFLSQSLSDQGLERRTVGMRLEGSAKGSPSRLLPQVEVFMSSLTTAEARAMGEGELWKKHAEELVSEYGGGGEDKFVAVMSATWYAECAEGEARPETHSEVMSRTTAHAALGGGGLALIGSGCLYSWPERLEEVQERLRDQTPVDWRKLMDDSAYRHTVGGCYATTLGSLLHELGHCLGLAHTADGIMARGFDDLDVFFAGDGGGNRRVVPSATDKRCLRSSISGDMLAKAKGTMSGMDLLEDYRRKQRKAKMEEACGGAFWSRSCALILRHHRWLKNCDTPAAIQVNEEDMMVWSSSPISVIEFRSKMGFVLHHWESVSAEGKEAVKELSLPEVLKKEDLNLAGIVDEVFIINMAGTFITQKL